jgi:dipeptide transport system substrate-binding protein
MNNLPIGTGPFKFVDYQTDAVIRYQAFPDYWGKAPIDRRPDLRDHARCGGAPAEAEGRRMRHLMPYPAPADIEAARPIRT